MALKVYRTHVISCLLSEIKRRDARADGLKPIRILDADCGNGDLILELSAVLSERKELAGRFDVFGLKNSQQLSGDQFSCSESENSLAERLPAIDWNSKIRAGSSGKPWPFDDRFFDFVLSRPALKPVGEMGWNFEQHYRVLGEFGVGIYSSPAEGISKYWEIGARAIPESGLGLAGRKRAVKARSLLQLPLWKQVQRVGERVGFRVRPRYTGALARRLLSGDLMAYGYALGSFDALIAPLSGLWLPVTLVLEKPRPQ